MQTAKKRTSWAYLIRLCFSMLVCGSFLGCESQNNARIVHQAVNEYYAGNFPAAIKELKPLADETNEDFVVNNLRLASAEMAPYALDDAEASFLRTIEVINSTGVNNGGRTLGAVLIDEKIKVWKGEPFERAMASYYLGVIYYMRHDYQNARPHLKMRVSSCVIIIRTSRATPRISTAISLQRC